METTKLQRTLGFTISAGAVLLLIVQLILVFKEEMVFAGFSNKILYYAFGSMFVLTQGYSNPITLLWIPWAAIILAVVLWFGIRLTQGKISKPYSAGIAIIGFLMLVGLILEKTAYPYYFYWRGTSFASVRDLASLITIIGIAIFVIANYRYIFATLIPETGSIAVSPTGEAAAPQTDTGQVTQAELTKGGFLSFRTMVSATIIKVLYFLGMLALTIGGLVGLFSGDDEGVIYGLLALTIGNLLWRIMCEGWILLFSMHDILGSVEALLRRK